MAKRIKIKSNPPRGLSKKERIVEGADARFKGEKRYVKRNPFSEPWMAESYLETAAGQRDYAAFSKDAKRGATRPSSTRKKRVKEGNRKFIGPRQLKSELAENRNVGMTNKYLSRLEATNLMEQEGADIEDPKLLAKYVRAIKNYRKAASRRRRGSTEPEYGRGTIGSEKLRNLLRNLERRNLGGGQEFDVQY